MTPYSLEDAQTRLKDLIQAAVQGETVQIVDGTGQMVQLTPVTEARPRKRRKAGSAKGLIWMSDDFDEPLDDFREYEV